ncbi:MAG: PorV/PorQ family protein [Melioribacteraceae bacterium]|nr:PorV/PorQ family protein [Melioribacteraceae bacterium]
MKLKRILPITIILLLCQLTTWSQEVSKVGTSAAPFLQIGVGSRAAGLGEAYTAVANDASAMYWNPAGLDRYTLNDAAFNYVDWFAGMKFVNFGAVIHSGELGSFGLSVTSFSTPEMVVRTVEEPEGLGTRFDAADLALGLSYSKKLTDRFSFGMTLKYINRRIWHMNATSVAMDFGIMYTLPWDKITLGMSILNFGQKLQMQGVDAIVFTDIDETITGNNTQIMTNLYTKEWSLPLSFRFGLAYRALEIENNKLLITADYIHPNDNFSSINVGCELTVFDCFALRSGYKSILIDTDMSGLTFGAGIKYDFVGIDYSYTKVEYLDYTQQISVKLNF